MMDCSPKENLELDAPSEDVKIFPSRERSATTSFDNESNRGTNGCRRSGSDGPHASPSGHRERSPIQSKTPSRDSSQELQGTTEERDDGHDGATTLENGRGNVRCAEGVGPVPGERSNDDGDDNDYDDNGDNDDGGAGSVSGSANENVSDGDDSGREKQSPSDAGPLDSQQHQQAPAQTADGAGGAAAAAATGTGSDHSPVGGAERSPRRRPADASARLSRSSPDKKSHRSHSRSRSRSRSPAGKRSRSPTKKRSRSRSRDKSKSPTRSRRQSPAGRASAGGSGAAAGGATRRPSSGGAAGGGGRPAAPAAPASRRSGGWSPLPLPRGGEWRREGPLGGPGGSRGTEHVYGGYGHGQRPGGAAPPRGAVSALNHSDRYGEPRCDPRDGPRPPSLRPRSPGVPRPASPHHPPRRRSGSPGHLPGAASGRQPPPPYRRHEHDKGFDAGGGGGRGGAFHDPRVGGPYDPPEAGGFPRDGGGGGGRGYGPPPSQPPPPPRAEPPPWGHGRGNDPSPGPGSGHGGGWGRGPGSAADALRRQRDALPYRERAPYTDDRGLGREPPAPAFRRGDELRGTGPGSGELRRPVAQLHDDRSAWLPPGFGGPPQRRTSVPYTHGPDRSHPRQPSPHGRLAASGGGGGSYAELGWQGRRQPSPPPPRRRLSGGGTDVGPRGFSHGGDPYSPQGPRGVGSAGRLALPPPSSLSGAAGGGGARMAGGPRRSSSPPYVRHKIDAPPSQYDKYGGGYRRPGSPPRPGVRSPTHGRYGSAPYPPYDMRGDPPPADLGARGQPRSSDPPYTAPADRYAVGAGRGWTGGGLSPPSSPPRGRPPLVWDSTHPRDCRPQPQPQYGMRSPPRDPPPRGATRPHSPPPPGPRIGSHGSRDAYERRPPDGGGGGVLGAGSHVYDQHGGNGLPYGRRQLSPRSSEALLPPAKRRLPPPGGEPDVRGLSPSRGRSAGYPGGGRGWGGGGGARRPSEVHPGQRNDRDPRHARAEGEPPWGRGGRDPYSDLDPGPSHDDGARRGRSPPWSRDREQRDGGGGGGGVLHNDGSSRQAARWGHGPTASGGSAAADTAAAAVHQDESAEVWYYIDPMGQRQGPCSIAQFRSWLKYLAQDDSLQGEYDKFRSCAVWPQGHDGAGGPRRTTLSELLRSLG